MKRVVSWRVLLVVLVAVAVVRWVTAGLPLVALGEWLLMGYLLSAAAPTVARDVGRLAGLWGRVPKRRRSVSGNGANTL